MWFLLLFFPLRVSAVASGLCSSLPVSFLRQDRRDVCSGKGTGTRGDVQTTGIALGEQGIDLQGLCLLEKLSRKTTWELGFPPGKTHSHPAGGLRRELQVGTWVTSLWVNYAAKALVLIPSTSLSAEDPRVEKNGETLHICLEIISQRQLFGAQVFPTHYLCGKAEVDRGAPCRFCCFYRCLILDLS